MNYLSKFRITLSVVALASTCMTPLSAITPQLYFQSLFESGVTIGNRTQPSATDGAQDVFGSDGSVRGHWQNSMEQRYSNNASGVPIIADNEEHYVGSIYLNRVKSASAYAEIIADPVVPGNKVMKWKVYTVSETDYPTTREHRGRVQMEFQYNKNWREFHQEVMLYLPSATFDRVKTAPGSWPLNWFLIQEFNNKSSAEASVVANDTARTVLGFFRDDATGILHWRANHQYGKNETYTDMWSRLSTAPIPLNEWFKLETYIKEGGNASSPATAGRFYVAMVRKDQNGNPYKTVLFNITGPTHSLYSGTIPSGFPAYSGLKMYANKNVIEHVNASGVNPVTMFFDNYRLWYGTYPWYMGNGFYVGNLSGVIPDAIW